MRFGEDGCGSLRFGGIWRGLGRLGLGEAERGGVRLWDEDEWLFRPGKVWLCVVGEVW